jgi:uncharacterized membrane protein YfcA
MEMSAPYFILPFTAFIISGLTLFSGFGLGTLLLPVFAFLFPLEVALAATAIIHMANNLFKVGLLSRQGDWEVVRRFGLPAAGAAVIGALCLTYMTELPALASYRLGGRQMFVSPAKAVVGSLIVLFAVRELWPDQGRKKKGMKISLFWGGMLSGFFGGLSGHQGALRSSVLLRYGLQKEVFIATGVLCAVLVDLARLLVYGSFLFSAHLDRIMGSGGLFLVGFTTLAAFGGAFLGTRLLKKITITLFRWILGIMLLIMGLALGLGFV